MSEPITVDVPHALGVDEAKRRVSGGFGQLGSWIPGGAVGGGTWSGDTFRFTVGAMGQTVEAQLLVMADKVRATLDLPPLLAMFAEPIRAKLKREGTKMLE